MLHQPALGGVKRGIKGPEIHRSAAAPSRRARRRCTVVTAASAAGPGVGGTPAKPLVVVGSVNADLVLCVDRLPQPGETLGARSLAFHPGGKGANQAAAAARLGQPTYFVGAVGSDSYAAPLRQALADAGVRLDHLTTVPGPSGTAVILLQDGGENSIIIVGGANQDLAAWQLGDGVRALIGSAGAVLLQREVPEAANLAVAKAAADAGVPVLLDAGGVDAPLPDELLALLDAISPNETELQRLTGMATDSPEKLLDAAAALQARARNGAAGSSRSSGLQVLLKLGTAGSMCLGAPDAPGLVRQPAVLAPRVVDTTGAGDCYTASFMVGRLEGRSTAEAMAFAAAAASICVSRPGAMPSLPSRAELDELLLQQAPAG